MYISHSVITPLTRIAFVYNGPKGMEPAPNPHYSGGSKSSARRLYSYASTKTCKGDDSNAKGNTKGWGHMNKLKQYKQIYKIQT